MNGIHSHFVDIDGIRTHYLEAGDGPTVFLMHSGEFGAAAELSWEFNLPELSRYFHVVAPDWLGFGRTDKLVDFGDARGRVYRHMSTFVKKLLNKRGEAQADFVGNSMGATHLLRIAAEFPAFFPMRSLIAASGGGFAPLTPERQILLAYDGTHGAMRALVRAMLYDKKWSEDETYVARRQDMASLPGAWSCTAAARLRPPRYTDAGGGFGKADNTRYEAIAVPTLLVAGANDPLRESGYADELAKRIPDCHVEVFEQCGHCPNIEQAEKFNALAIEFIQNIHRRTSD